MSKKLKRPIAFMAAVAMMLTMLMYLPSGVITDIGFGLAVSAEGTAHTHAPCGKESCGYNSHNSTPYKPFSLAKFWGNGVTPITFNGNTSLDLSEYEIVNLNDGDYYLDNDYTINTQSSICFYGNICLNGHKLTITTVNLSKGHTPQSSHNSIKADLFQVGLSIPKTYNCGFLFIN